MELSSFSGLLDKIEAFTEDAVVSVSLWGEPALHSQAERLLLEALGRRGLRTVIETSGVGWEEGTLEAIARASSPPPQWVVSLDAWDPGMYRRLRGEGFDVALRTTEELLARFGDNVYVQAVRLCINTRSTFSCLPVCRR